MTSHAPTYTTNERCTACEHGARAQLGSLQALLWTAWTILVVAIAGWHWYADVARGHQLDLLGIVIHSALAGIIGLIGITLVEMRLEPWRFWDDPRQ